MVPSIKVSDARKIYADVDGEHGANGARSLRIRGAPATFSRATLSGSLLQVLQVLQMRER
jgi:hypothetical protein